VAPSSPGNPLEVGVPTRITGNAEVEKAVILLSCRRPDTTETRAETRAILRLEPECGMFQVVPARSHDHGPRGSRTMGG
jgi:hypothetical protein